MPMEVGRVTGFMWSGNISESAVQVEEYCCGVASESESESAGRLAA